MLRKVMYLFPALCFFLQCASTLIANAGMQEVVWNNVSGALRDVDLYTVAVSEENSETVYISSLKAVFKTADDGKTWTEILSLRGTGNRIISLSLSSNDMQTIYTGTTDGLYRSGDGGLKWERIFKGVGEPANAVLSVATDPLDPAVIYIGTATGVFFTRNNGTDWARGQNLPSVSAVSSITINPHNPNIVYAASVRGIYKSVNSGIGWKRIYESKIDAEDFHYGIEEEEVTEETDRTVLRDKSHIRDILTDPADSSTIYGGTSEGLLVTNNSGLTWRFASTIGLVSHNIRDIAVTSSDIKHVYAATDRGIFRYAKDTQSWDELYKGMVSSDIRYLDFASAEQNVPPVLWAVTRRVIYRSSPSLPESAQKNPESTYIKTDTQDTRSLFDHEPSIEEIKEAAIDYAEVSPDKIRKWRKEAAHRAWLPDLRFAYDKGKDWQNSYTYYKVDGEYVKYDDITKDRDKGWSISLTWELGDLIWNSAQTSIDARSRLMVQLRDDVLNEVTRLYFERRRLQYELFFSPPENIQEKIEKELRLQELTANIDALTGSYLSKRLNQASGVRSQRETDS